MFALLLTCPNLVEFELLTEYKENDMDKVLHIVPRWLAEALMVYFKEVRPNFTTTEGVSKVKRVFKEYFVVTEKFFVNSKGKTDFEMRQIPSTKLRKINVILESPNKQRKEHIDRVIKRVLPEKHVPTEGKTRVDDITKSLCAKEAMIGFKYNEVREAVSKRHGNLRYIREQAQAAAFVFRHPVAPRNEEKVLQAFAVSENWNKFGDTKKVLQAAKEIRESGTSRRLRRCFNPNLEINQMSSFAFQITLKQKCQDQDWAGICDAVFPGMGRGVMSLKHFKRNDVVADYHGQEVQTQQSVEDYVSENPELRKNEYIFEILQNGRMLLDASIEPCLDHPQRRCLARLCNYACENDFKCNLRLVEVKMDKIERTTTHARRHFVLVARRDIDPFEQLMVDYKDPEAKKKFHNRNS